MTIYNQIQKWTIIVMYLVYIKYWKHKFHEFKPKEWILRQRRKINPFKFPVIEGGAAYFKVWAVKFMYYTDLTTQIWLEETGGKISSLACAYSLIVITWIVSKTMFLTHKYTSPHFPGLVQTLQWTVVALSKILHRIQGHRKT